ncbi:unnamed protein product [Protopolystoma xenopodis]|uniref:Uncharacterized protein n=1 Tax=Protopolystoma xenopodis TaxID=117903 RepID=A0A3S5FF77_9PLAT|nr:unnamed protein product [Protopolystoma xenopodis]
MCSAIFSHCPEVHLTVLSYSHRQRGQSTFSPKLVNTYMVAYKADLEAHIIKSAVSLSVNGHSDSFASFIGGNLEVEEVWPK